MQEIFIEPRRTSSLKHALMDAVGNGEYESLSNDIRDSFNDDQIKVIEELLDCGDIDEIIDEIITDWSGDNVVELFETMEAFFAESEIELHFDETDLDMDMDQDSAEDDEEDLDSLMPDDNDDSQSETDGENEIIDDDY